MELEKLECHSRAAEGWPASLHRWEWSSRVLHCREGVWIVRLCDSGIGFWVLDLVWRWINVGLALDWINVERGNGAGVETF